ncbi:acetyl-CoA carboxylase biotin carboxyl carrier protein [Ghiorsea bivora]|uniref:acetyl-CoA carboxylase biotin carboxyl carrier protein n=1 Tax=Ghiorsea bivora TaxID=1485545 RepID=UPI0005709252|nr:acetyl-CoA carboxylase biotin carboxyl carrier protein [Ghiorsea bivora]
MDIAEIRKLIRLVQQSDVTEIEVTEGESTVRISRQGMVAAAVAAPQAVAAAPLATAATAAPAPAAIAEEPSEDEEHVVKSPMVGTFYAASSPDDDPFVSEGSIVKKGDVLCIVEAMKLMNEIEAEYDGVVKKVLAKNAQPLEYGQPIFVITPA